MRQVLVPTDDLESTTQGKYNKGDWMVFITFQKCLQVSILLKLMEFFYLYSELIFAERPFLRERGKVWANFDLASSCPWFLQFFILRVNVNFPSSDLKRIYLFTVRSLTHVTRAVYRPGSEYYLLNLYKTNPFRSWGMILPLQRRLVVIGVLAFIILLLMAYIIWIHRKGK